MCVCVCGGDWGGLLFRGASASSPRLSSSLCTGLQYCYLTGDETSVYNLRRVTEDITYLVAE